MRYLLGTTTAFFVTLIVILMLLPSCGIFGSKQGEFQPIQSLVLFKIDDAPLQYDGEPSDLMKLDLITAKKYGCKSCRVISNLHFRGDTVVIQLYGVHIPENCDDVVGPARGSHLLNIDEGRSSILFQHGDQRDLYDLEISTRTITITSREAHVTRPIHNIIQR